MAVALELVDSLTVGDAIVGGGTLLLASFTGWLGWSTRESARAAQQAVEQAEEPYVIGVPSPPEVLGIARAGEIPPMSIHRWRERQSGGGTRDLLRLRLWNIGSGPAIVHEVRLTSHEHRELREIVLAAGLEAHVPIAAGQWADVSVPSARWHEPGTGLLRVEYEHSNGNDYATNSDVTIAGNIVQAVTYPRYRDAKRTD